MSIGPARTDHLATSEFHGQAVHSHPYISCWGISVLSNVSLEDL